MNLKKDQLEIKLFSSREDMGRAAACDITDCIKKLLLEKEEMNIIFAAAPSQKEVLHDLCSSDVEWSRVNAFHMDEYIGLPSDAPQCFSNFLRKAIFDQLPFKTVNYMNSSAQTVTDECRRYANLLAKNPVDIVIMGIGENGHIAFNDPHVADFKDPETVKLVSLDEVCRRQQVNDGCFETLEDVPSIAMTITIPALMQAEYHFCIVPGKTKANAVQKTLYGDIAESCPATILRTKQHSVLYCDAESSIFLHSEDFQ